MGDIATRTLEVLDQAGVDQQPIETPCLPPFPTRIEQTVTAFEDFLLFGK
jgi:hypothetical protein